MSKPVSLYQQFWSDKRYLKMLTCRKECDFSNPERKVLSFLVLQGTGQEGRRHQSNLESLGT